MGPVVINENRYVACSSIDYVSVTVQELNSDSVQHVICVQGGVHEVS